MEMERQYNDMYALFRHDHSAEEYFDSLPSYVQDRVRPRYQMVDSFDRLASLADECRRG